MNAKPIELPFLSASGQPGTLLESSRLKLFGFYEVPFRQGMVMAVRNGTRQRVLTSECLGIHAIRLLRQGRSVAQVRRQLAENQGIEPERLDLLPVLKSLLTGHFVDRIDGVPVKTNRLSRYRTTYGVLRHRWLAKAIGSLAAHLPLKSEEKLVRTLRWKLYGLPKLRVSQDLIAEKYRNLFPEKEFSQCRHLAEQYLRFRHYLTYCYETVSKPQRLLEKWASIFVDDEVEGLEYLREAQAHGRGIIFTGFHHGLFWILPPVIYYKLGIRHNVLLTTKLNHDDIDQSLVRFFVQNTENIGKIARLLMESQQTLLMFPDAISRYKDHEVGKMVHRSNWTVNATTRFTMLGREIEANKGITWFHRLSHAPVLPVMLLWRHGRPAKLVIGPPASDLDYRKRKREDRRTYDHQVVHNVYAQLETWVRQHPEQWVNFPKWLPEPKENPHEVAV